MLLFRHLLKVLYLAPALVVLFSCVLVWCILLWFVLHLLLCTSYLSKEADDRQLGGAAHIRVHHLSHILHIGCDFHFLAKLVNTRSLSSKKQTWDGTSKLKYFLIRHLQNSSQPPSPELRSHHCGLASFKDLITFSPHEVTWRAWITGIC